MSDIGMKKRTRITIITIISLWSVSFAGLLTVVFLPFIFEFKQILFNIFYGLVFFPVIIFAGYVIYQAIVYFLPEKTENNLIVEEKRDLETLPIIESI